ncbi:response regulator [Sporolactobacillus kofuensis]|uniref:Response regulator n=1 Tax=Sporolactobacillus kofuensis TaxID=269672 RepID=A0ABW1WAW4_9BACL|nr:response regulator [Sporolactobacillus kofuensis]MCO7174794.1 response regulator [Sporolactobacillus kofuensis]
MLKTILIVDDSRFMRTFIRNKIDSSLFCIAGEASNGLEAVDQYSTLHPDLVIMDITMPLLSGIDALRRIMKLDPKAKVIMCSSLGSEQLVIEAIQFGAKEFVLKPFFDDLNEKLKSVLHY